MAHQKSPAHAHSSPSIYNLKKSKGAKQKRTKPYLFQASSCRSSPSHLSRSFSFSLPLCLCLSPPAANPDGGDSGSPSPAANPGGRGSGSPSPSPAAAARALPLRQPRLALSLSGGRGSSSPSPAAVTALPAARSGGATPSSRRRRAGAA